MAQEEPQEIDVKVFANPLKDREDISKKPKRIKSIDLVKGFAMVFIIICHSSGGWLDDDWIFLHGEVYMVLDVLGPSLFIFLSALSVIFSVKSKEGKLPQGVIRNKIFMRGIVIIGIGILYNSFLPPNIGGTSLPFPYSLWSWSILVFIGFSQIISYYAIRLPKLPRLIIGVFIIMISLPIREWLLIDLDTNALKQVLHYIIVSKNPQVTLLPWFGYCFIASLFGEMLYEAMNRGTPEAHLDLVKKFLLYGCLLVVIGVVMGYNLKHYLGENAISYKEYPSIMLLWYANTNPFGVIFPGMPSFLIRGMPSNQFYNLGMALIILAIAFYIVDIKNKDNHLIRILIFFGKISLSMFLFHYIGIILLISYQLNIVFFPFACLAFIGFLGMLFFIWMRYADGVGTPEWLMVKMGNIGKKKKEK